MHASYYSRVDCRHNWLKKLEVEFEFDNSELSVVNLLRLNL